MYRRANFSYDALTLADPDLVNQTLGQSMRTAGAVTDALQKRVTDYPMDVFADQADILPGRLRDGLLDTLSPYHAGRNLGRRLEAMNTEGMSHGLPDITGNIKRGIDSSIDAGGDVLDTAIKGIRQKAGTIQESINQMNPGSGPIPQELSSSGIGKVFTNREQVPQELSTPFSPRNVTPPNTQALLGGAAAGSGVAAGLTALGNKVARSRATPLTEVSSKFMRESNLRQAEFGFMPHAMDMVGQVQLPSANSIGQGLAKAGAGIARTMDNIGVDDVAKGLANTYRKVKAPMDTAKQAYGMLKPALQGNLVHAKAMLQSPGISLKDFNPLPMRG